MKDHTLSLLGKKIRQIRKRKGLNLQEVARKSQVTAGLISKIENFRTIPSLPVLLNISRALEVDMSELVSSVDQPKSTYKLVRKREYESEMKANKQGIFFHKLLSREMQGVLMRTAVEKIPSGIKTQTEEQPGMVLVYVVSGKLSYWLPNEQIDMQAGDTLLLENSAAFMLENLGPADAELFKVYLQPQHK
ncbi:MAG: XRE family transcriptional regulator [Bacteroidetes bacterium]|nr:MAG: XRE family transcriptional regulator [Bacteroidota bacterium]